MRKSKAAALPFIVVTTTIFDVSVFSVSASEYVTTEEEETAPAFCGFRNRWLDTLTDDQLATLQETIEENQAEIQDQLETWGAKIFELDDEKRELLKPMIEENRAEVQAQLEAWGVEVPMRQGPMGWLDSLTDEQKEELQTMRQEYQDAVNAKLEEWGIKVPEVDGSRGFGMGFRGSDVRGLCLFKP